ncbi:MAG TPA: hypothetical protein VKG03_04520 [Solirubrobacterales bacterium]|nr:hypothetical protein [Solirubrobacterales bacterium]
MLDLAGMLSAARVERLLQRSEELRLFDLVPLREAIGRSGHHPGAAKLRRALAIYHEDPTFTRSGLERRFLALVRQAGLPTPSMNFNVGGFELDSYWERERFAVELDVYETHGSHGAFERDRLRQEDLKLIGIEMTRVTGARLDREPKKVMERIAALLERRRRELGG